MRIPDDIRRLEADWDRYYEELGGGATREEAARTAATHTESIARRHAGLRWDRWTEEEREAYTEYIEGMGH